jgi:hypothetical protein
MTLSPTAKYWLGWMAMGLVSVVAEYWVIYAAVCAALEHGHGTR